MPKLKTHKATSKRFTMTKSGKIMHRKSGISHLRRKKSQRIRHLFGRKLEVTGPAEQRHVERLAPYLRKTS